VRLTGIADGLGSLGDARLIDLAGNAQFGGEEGERRGTSRCCPTLPPRAAAWRGGRGEYPMLKVTKLTFAAALLVGSCGLAMAQGAGADKTEGSETGRGRPAMVQGAGADKTEGSETGRGRPAMVQPQPATSGAQSSGQQSSGNAMQEKNTNLNTGQETGTAKDSAGPGQVRQQTK
jgi:hypothetical protein